MATILNDEEIRKILGKVILGADEGGVRPNCYILRVGGEGEFLNTGKAFSIGDGAKKKGIKIPCGHSVGLTSLESLDFSREVVRDVYPGCDLHGILSPTTDLSREGVVAPTTQVDAGYKGTLNWTVSNTSNRETKFLFGEKIYRLTILKLEKGETPANTYHGYYQDQEGYVPSNRPGAPAGMKASEWEGAFFKEGAEHALENLMQSGYPWSLLGTRLKEIDNQFQTITKEYDKIDESIKKLSKEIVNIKEEQGKTPDKIRRLIREETGALQNRWLLGAGSIALAIIGLLLSVFSSDALMQFAQENGVYLGGASIILAAAILIFINRQK